MNSRKTGVLFAGAILMATVGPYLFLSSKRSEAYAVPEPALLSRSDSQFVVQRIAEYCQTPYTEKEEPTPASLPIGQEVPIVLYHRVTDVDHPSHEVIHPQLFRSQMDWLKAEGYTTISVKRLTEYMQGKGTIPKKPVVLTFDDGWKDNFEAAKYLKELDFGATFYIISGFFDAPMYLDEDEVVELSKNPQFEIGSHTHSHFVKWETKINTLDLCTMVSEMVASKHILERLIKKPVTSIAWPYGYNTKEAIHVAKQVGYTSTMLVNADSHNAPGNSPLFIRRMNIDGNCSLSDFQEMVQTRVLKNCS